jgi:hypothetical protein
LDEGTISAGTPKLLQAIPANRSYESVPHHFDRASHGPSRLQLRRRHAARVAGRAGHDFVGGMPLPLLLSSKPKRSAAWVWDVYRKVEKLGPLQAAWCMLHYGARAVLKRLVF